MKLILIQPPIEDFYYTPVRRQPLGLLYLAGIAKSKNWETLLINAHSPKKSVLALPDSFSYLTPYIENHTFPFKNYYHWGASWQEIEKQIRENKGELFAISSLFTPYYQESETVIRLIQKYHPEALIAAGGSHATLFPDYYLDTLKVNFVIAGEGEKAFSCLLDFIQTGKKEFLFYAPNLFFKEKRGYGELFPEENLDLLPFPQRDLLKERDLFFYRKKGVSLIAGRGCPNQCSFCSSRKVFGNQYRVRSIDNIMKEIDECVVKYQAHFFNFEDDNLFHNHSFAIDFLKILIKYQKEKNMTFDFTAMNGISAETLDEEILTLMKKAGFQELNLALVTASLKTQNQLKRPFDSSHFQIIVQQAQKIGFNLRTYFILGLPNQTKEEIQLTDSFLKKLNLKAIPSVYYDIFENNPEKWKIQRSSGFANETKYLSRKDLIVFFNLFVKEFVH